MDFLWFDSLLMPMEDAMIYSNGEIERLVVFSESAGTGSTDHLD